MKYIIGPTFCRDSLVSSAPLAQEIEIVAGALAAPDDRRLTISFWRESPDELRGHIHVRGWWAAEPFVFQGTQRMLVALIQHSTNEREVLSDRRFELAEREATP